jgi:hypothetical protein
VQIILADDVTLRVEEEGARLLDPHSEAEFALDAVGLRLWQLLREDGDFARALAHLLQEFEVEEAELRTDLLELLNDLAEVGLVAVEAALD